MRSTLLLAGVIVLVTAPAAAAQDRPVNFTIGGGVTFPVGDVADTFDTGGFFQTGLTFNFNDDIGFQADYMFHWLPGPDRTFPALVGGSPVLIESNHQLHVGSFNLIVRTPSTSPVAAYVLGGPGVYYRKVELTTPSVGLVTVCDPYWFVCYPTAVEVDTVVGDRSSTDFGFDVGGGVTFGGTVRFFVEARYHYVWGDDITLPDGSTRSTNSQYFPIAFGIRF